MSWFVSCSTCTVAATVFPNLRRIFHYTLVRRVGNTENIALVEVKHLKNYRNLSSQEIEMSRHEHRNNDLLQKGKNRNKRHYSLEGFPLDPLLRYILKTYLLRGRVRGTDRISRC